MGVYSSFLNTRNTWPGYGNPRSGPFFGWCWSCTPSRTDNFPYLLTIPAISFKSSVLDGPAFFVVLIQQFSQFETQVSGHGRSLAGSSKRAGKNPNTRRVLGIANKLRNSPHARKTGRLRNLLAPHCPLTRAR